MTDRTRRWAVVLAGLAIVAMVLLSAGLSSLELLPGGPLVRQAATQEPEPGAPPELADELGRVLLIVMGALAVLLVAFLVLYVLFAADTRKRLLIIVGVLLSLLILWFVSQTYPSPPEEARQTPSASVEPTEALATALPAGPEITMVDLAVNPPAWLVWVGATALALLTIGLLAGIAWLVWGRHQGRPDPLEQLAREAEWAMEALRAGADLDDTIMRCYFQMSDILHRHLGISRPEAMTPSEFERGLRRTGLPQAPVALLTHLFEKVRYGAGVPAEDEEQQAVAALAAVAAACRGEA